MREACKRKPHSLESRVRQGLTMRERNRGAKTCCFVSLFGERVRINNLARFCEENNLTLQLIYAVRSGKQPQHKGWRKDVIDCKAQKPAV